MESVGVNEVKKRRLPPWMMGAVDSKVISKGNKDDRVESIKPGGIGAEVRELKAKTRSRKIVKKSLCEDEEACVTDEVSVPKTKMRSRKIVNESLDEIDESFDLEEVNAPKPKRISNKWQKGTRNENIETITDGSCVLVKCDTVKRKRKAESEAEDPVVNSSGCGELDQIAAPQKMKKKKKKTNKLPTEVASSCTDNGRKLLMEDLISIAEEYVKAESLSEQQQQTVGGSDPDVKLLAAGPFFDESAHSFDGTQTHCASAVTEVKSSLPYSSDQVQYTTTINNISKTGDAAQDMLNLLLGPLLMKPGEESTSTLNHNDLLIDRPVRDQSQNHIIEELAPPVKKKTSLKDKVAMFLD